ncbi:MAG TPA: AEC family transporter [Oscillatoriaceae cyanobacterium]
MLALVLFVVVMVAAGYVLRKIGLVQAESAKDFNHLVLYVTLPALIFMALYHAKLSWSLLYMPAIAWVVVLSGLALGYAIARALKLDRPDMGALMLVVAFANTTYFGYPIIQAFYGTQQLTLAIFYDQLGATLAVNTLGFLVASAMGESRVKLGQLLKRLLTFPPVWALVLGLGLHGVALPPLLTQLLEHVGDLTSPVIMFSIGLSLRFSAWRENLGLVAIATSCRLVLLPLVALALTRVLGLPLPFEQAAVMQAAMPVMFFSLSLALLFNLRLNLVVNTIMLSTVLSFLTLPIWHALLH